MHRTRPCYGRLVANPRRRANYADLMKVPDTKVAEIIDGGRTFERVRFPLDDVSLLYGLASNARQLVTRRRARA